MDRKLFVYGMLGVGNVLLVLAYDFISNKPLFILGTVVIALSGVIIAVDLVKGFWKWLKGY